MLSSVSRHQFRQNPEAYFWSFVQKADGDACWLWTKSTSRYGYGQQFWTDGKNWIAHRLAWTLTHGAIPKSVCLCHRCDNPACVRPSHMFLGTQADNLADMRAKGRGFDFPTEKRGEKNPRARLTDNDVREIRRRHAAGESIKRLGKAFNYAHTNISAIIRGKIWAHVR